VTKERIEANVAKTTVVRVRRPFRLPAAEFVALMSAWLDHQCILLADLEVVSFAKTEGLFDAEFDNPQDAHLFARRFAGQLILSHTPSRADRNHPNRLFQLWSRLNAQQEASAIVGARVT
jgi:hypothetical protein